MPIRRLEHTGKVLQAEAAVDSPLAVARELIDNAIDAAATAITIAVDSQTGGLQHISVRDNGSGIHNDDYNFVFSPSCTSKHGETGCLGFRGEALHLISRVARECRITTKTATDPTATQWEVHPPINRDEQASTQKSPNSGPFPPIVKRVAAPTGTTITVKDLFYNTPVRRKLLLKKPASNSIQSIESLVKCYAIIHAPKRFTFKLVGKCHGYKEAQSTVRFVSPPHSNAQTLLSQWSSTVLVTFTPFSPSNTASEITITAPASPSLSGSAQESRTQPIISVNKRLLSTTRGTGKAFKRSFNTVFTEVFPHYKSSSNVPWMLTIQCPESHIDANIEPKKDDVLLTDHDAILTGFEAHLRDVLRLTSTLTTVQMPGSTVAVLDKVSAPHGSTGRSSKPEFQVIETANTHTRNEVLSVTTPHVFTQSSVTNAQAPQQLVEPLSSQCSISESESEPSNACHDHSWSRSMHDKLSSESDSQSVDLNKSANTYNTSITDESKDDDLILAKDISLSNPFIMMNMRGVPKAKQTVNPTPSFTASTLGISAGVPRVPHQDKTAPTTSKGISAIKHTLNQSTGPKVKKPKTTHGSTNTKHSASTSSNRSRHHKSVTAFGSTSTKFRQSTLPLKSNSSRISWESGTVHERTSCNPSVLQIPWTEVGSLEDGPVGCCGVVVTWGGECVVHEDKDNKETTVDAVVRWIDGNVKERCKSDGVPALSELEGWWLATYD